jgi:hypothetical protein
MQKRKGEKRRTSDKISRVGNSKTQDRNPGK